MWCSGITMCLVVQYTVVYHCDTYSLKVSHLSDNWQPDENPNTAEPMSHQCIPSNESFHQSWKCYTKTELSNVWLYLVGTVMLFDPGLQANVQIELVFLVVACPCYFLKAIGLGVDELGVLGDRLVWVPDKNSKEGKSFKWKNSQSVESCSWFLASQTCLYLL